MRAIYKMILILLPLVLSAEIYAEEMKLYLDDTHTDHIIVEKQDCSIHKAEDGSITLGFKVGNFLIGAGPEITFGKKSGIDWNNTIQGFIARYQELCSRFNTGSMTKQEYDTRLAQIEQIDKEAQDTYQKFLVEKEKGRRDLFDELDNEARKLNPAMSEVKRDYDKINSKLNGLSFKDSNN